MAELVLPSGAIKVIQSQQQMVGGAITGGAGSVSNSMSGDTIQVLEDIKEISLRQFKGLTKVAKLLADTLNFDKSQARRKKDQSAEVSKENKIKGGFIGPMSNQGAGPEEDEGGGMGLGGAGLLAGLGLGSVLKKAKGIIVTIVKPFKRLLVAFGAFTRLTPLLGKLGPMLMVGGPIGLVISGLFLLVQYSDEIVKALTPMIDKMAKVFEELKPIFDIIMEVLDSGIKMGITTLGASLSAVGDVIGGVADLIMGIFDTVSVIFTGAKDLIDGKISGMDFVKLIWDQGIKKILMAPINMLKNLGETMFDFIKGLVKSLPFGIGDKLISGMKGMTEGSQAGTAGDIAGEASMDNFSGGDTITSTAPSASGAVASKIEDPKEETVVTKPKAKPKTVNMDKTSGVTKVAEKISGDPNLPPLGLNMCQTTGDTYEERKKQWNDFKDALVQAEKDGSISKEEIKFRIMQMRFERDNLVRNRDMIDLKKRQAELRGETFTESDETSLLNKDDKRGAEIQENGLAVDGMTVASYDEALKNKLQPNVNKRDLKGDGAGSQGSVTVVNNQPSSVNTSTNVAKTSVTSVPLNTSSGDSYFDKQANNIHV
jgi:hypothetical protein